MRIHRGSMICRETAQEGWIELHDKHLALASELYLAGHRQSMIFDISELKINLRFAEDLLQKMKSMDSSLKMSR